MYNDKLKVHVEEDVNFETAIYDLISDEALDNYYKLIDMDYDMYDIENAIYHFNKSNSRITIYDLNNILMYEMDYLKDRLASDKITY